MKPTEPPTGHSGSALGDVARGVFAVSWFAVGGPEAHMGVLESELIERRRWASRERFLELFSLASMLPGPTSTQVVIGLGAIRAGAMGGVLALLVWLAPATVLMTSAALALGWWTSRGGTLDALRGLYPAAVGLIAVAGWRLGTRVVKDARTCALLMVGAVVAVTGQIEGVRDAIAPVNPAYRFPLVIVVGGIVASVLSRNDPALPAHEPHTASVRRTTGVACLLTFLALFVTMPAIAALLPSDAGPGGRAVLASDALYRSGSIVVGGGQVVLPMLHDEFVQRNWVTDEEFWSAFGLVQAAPGPLFSFSAFLGGATAGRGDPFWTVIGALLGVASLFGPGALIWFGVDPFWTRLRGWPRIRRALPGAQAAAVGLIVGAFWLMAGRVLQDWLDYVFIVFAVGVVLFARWSPLMMLAASAVVGAIAWALGL